MSGGMRIYCSPGIIYTPSWIPPEKLLTFQQQRHCLNINNSKRAEVYLIPNFFLHPNQHYALSIDLSLRLLTFKVMPPISSLRKEMGGPVFQVVPGM